MNPPTPRLLLALLLALAGCKLSTDDLAPKTDADCAPDEKACGYKCVSRADPTTGCGVPGCSPCPPASANTVAGCTVDFACAYECAPGWYDCSTLVDDGCETRVATDPANCGACGRSCGTASCSGGACGAEWIDPWSEPRGIVSKGDVIYWVEKGWSDTGDVYRWDPHYGNGAFDWSNAVEIATALDPGATNAVYRLSTHSGVSDLYASGATASGDLAIFLIDTSVSSIVDATPFYWRPGSTTESMIGLAVVPAGIFFTTTGDSYVHYVITATTDGAMSVGGAPVGLTGYLEDIYLGYSGALSKIDVAPGTAPILVTPPVLSGFSSSPSRIAVFSAGVSGEMYFWADERDGSVWSQSVGGTLYTADVGSGSSTAMDIVADAWGVVWSNSVAGRVRAWRAADGAVFDLPTGGGQPLGVTLTPGHICWTERAAGGAPNGVYRVPK